MNTDLFKAEIIEYLSKEKELIEADIEAHQQLSDTQKVDDGLLIQNAVVVSKWGTNCYDLRATVNNTRLRPGDKIKLQGNKNKDATVIENGLYDISIHCDSDLNVGDVYDIAVTEAYLLEPLQKILGGLCAGAPGYSFMSQLSEENPVTAKGYFPINNTAVATSMAALKLDADKDDCCRKIADAPSIMCLQGPPGTGKTFCLAAAVNMVSLSGQQSLVLALTHQAVHNALNQIRKINPAVPIIKVGSSAKAQSLDPTIGQFSSVRDYAASLTTVSRSGKKKTANPPKDLVIGMTFHAAVVQFGLMHRRELSPIYLFLDEASQIPMPYASVLGTFGAGSVCLFGDSCQMPPIFHPNLASHPLSVSILDWCSRLVDVPVSVLHTTYRMNEPITRCVSRNFYEPYKITLNSDASSKGRMLNLPCLTGVFQDPISIVSQRYSAMYTDSNPEEVKSVMDLVQQMNAEGLSFDDMAVITPYRRQVCALRNEAMARFGKKHDLLIDTVERLQGQEVECIILSFAASDPNFIAANHDFLFNPNRLNVMISRARTKVLIFASDVIVGELRLDLAMCLPSIPR